jgi:hypothetical protein
VKEDVQGGSVSKVKEIEGPGGGSRPTSELEARIPWASER